MLDYQRIVDDVRSSLFSHSAEGIDFLRLAAANYSFACDEINERLRQCGVLLRQGLRSEAIRLGEIDPNVLDVVALLDFPEREQWIGLARRHQIAPPAPLMIDIAAELNAAYAVEQPMAALLQHHRLLALAHGPLPTRIEVLRKLAEHDANNPVWQEDLQIFEQERQKQLQAEVDAAARAGDTATLAALDAELSSPEWRNPPPPALAQAAAEAKTTVQYWAVQSQLEGVTAELEAALLQARLDRGVTLYTQWNEIIARTGWQPHPHLLKRTAPALQWVQRYLEREAAVAALADALDNELPAAQLKAAYRRATESGALDDSLEERYQTQLASIQRAAKWLLGLKIGAGLAAGIAVALLIGWVVSHERYEQEIASASKNFPFLIDRGEYERAEQLVEQLSSDAKRDPRLQESLTRLEDKLKHEIVRQAEFTQRLGAVEYWLAQVRKSLAQTPNQTVLTRLREELTRIQTDLVHAAELARMEPERTRVVSIKEAATQTTEQWQRQLDEAFLGQYDDYEKRLVELEADDRSALREYQRMVGDYKRGLRQWELASKHVSAALATRITTLGERLDSLETKVRQREQEERDTKRLTAAVGDVPAYLKALQQYAAQNPGSDRNPDFKQVAEESLGWQAVAEWNKLALLWRESGFAGFHPATGKDHLALATAVAQNFAECPECEDLQRLLPHLKAVAERDLGGERLEKPLQKLFADPLVAGAWMVELQTPADSRTKTGPSTQRYYFLETPPVTTDSEAGATFRFVAGFDGKTKTGFVKQNDRIAYVGRAPQAIMAAKIQPILRAINDANWDESFCQIIAAIHADHAIDPVLKVNLLQQALDTGTRGSHGLATAFGRHLEWIKAARINAFSNWLDPEDAEVANERKSAATKLQGFPGVDPAIQAVKQAGKTKYHLPEFRWVGWLRRDREGRWGCLTNAAPGESGTLYVVARQPSGEKPVLKAVGRYDRRAAIVDASAGSSLVEGRPVFLELP